MSRSYKKPYVDTAGIGKNGAMAHWKNDCNRTVRRIPIDKEIPDGKYIRKMTDQWSAPNDGKHYWDKPEARRK